MANVQRVKRKLSDGSYREHFYLRVPKKLQHVMGHRVRLPSECAEDAAVRLASTEIKTIAGAKDRIDRFAKKAHDNAFARANKRAMEYGLSKQIIVQMMEDQGYLCAVSGLPFSLEWGAGKNPFAPSLDRKDNSKGYTRENARLVLSAVNFGMNVWGLDIYAAICAAVAHKQNVLVDFDVNRFRKAVNGVCDTAGEPPK